MAAVREVGAIGLTVQDPGRELNFFTNTLPFELVSISDASGKEQEALLGLRGVRLRIATLRLGDESITLTEHLGRKGRPIPQDSRSFDRWFQHIAIVVSDMDRAYARLLDHKVTHVSTAPQTLPDWNKDAGGIKAFYFRDPEDHVLEIIWFPPGKGNPKWQQSGDRLFLGIDHTAIVVSDTGKSLAFYRDQLGFKVAGGAHNYGTKQEHLNQVFGARLRITALKAEHGPGIELLDWQGNAATVPRLDEIKKSIEASQNSVWSLIQAKEFPDRIYRMTGDGDVQVYLTRPVYTGQNVMQPGLRGRLFQRQKSRNLEWCRRMTVLG